MLFAVHSSHSILSSQSSTRQLQQFLFPTMTCADFSHHLTTTTSALRQPLLNRQLSGQQNILFPATCNWKATRFSSANHRDWPQPSWNAQIGSVSCPVCLSCGDIAIPCSASLRLWSVRLPGLRGRIQPEGISLARERYTWPEGKSLFGVTLRRMKLFNAFSLKFFEIP